MTTIPELPVILGMVITIIAVSGSIAPAYATNIHDVPIGMGVKLTNMQELPVLDREYDYAYHLWRGPP